MIVSILDDLTPEEMEAYKRLLNDRAFETILNRLRRNQIEVCQKWMDHDEDSERLSGAAKVLDQILEEAECKVQKFDDESEAREVGSEGIFV